MKEIVDENRTQLAKFYEQVYNQGNLSWVDELFAARYINHSEPGDFPVGRAQPDPISSAMASGERERLKEYIAALLRGFPDLRVSVDDMIAEGDRVVAHITLRGTQHGEFQGLPASGRRFSAGAIVAARFDQGRIVEFMGGPSPASLVRQLSLEHSRFGRP
jgi:steroid delta-isomerase-like uncharacterized protein